MREQDYAVHHGQQVEQQEISKVPQHVQSAGAHLAFSGGVMAFVAQQCGRLPERVRGADRLYGLFS